jgi:hypothetical protein
MRRKYHPPSGHFVRPPLDTRHVHRAGQSRSFQDNNHVELDRSCSKKRAYELDRAQEVRKNYPRENHSKLVPPVSELGTPSSINMSLNSERYQSETSAPR